MQNKTIVGWNASEASEEALRWAVERERSRDGVISVVFVVDDKDGGVPAGEVARQLTEARAALRDTEARVRESAPRCSVTSTAVEGATLDALLEFANHDWVLAVGTTQRGSRKARSGQSVGARLASAAQGPVAVIPGGRPSAGVGIVAAIDGTVAASLAARLAASEAHRFGEALTLVHAWSEPVLMEGQPLDAQFTEALEQESDQLLAHARAELVDEFPEVSVDIRSVRGQTATTLVELSHSAREIVLGSRGLRGLRRILLGSVSREVVVRAECPTIVVGRVPHPATPAAR